MSSERQDHDENNPWWGEHIHRYEMVFPYVSDDSRILDIACGNGFGSYLLSNKTSGEVTGADISPETIEKCRHSFPKQENLKFRVMDGTKLPFENDYFDLLVSFETIEHTTQFREMLAEFARVLKKDGLAVISTPNIVVNSPGGIVTNPYHTQEFTYDELQVILNTSFSDVKIGGQKYVRYSNKTFRNRIAEAAEKVLYMRGFRKIPLSIQNVIMNTLIHKNMYPLPSDYEIIYSEKEAVKCKTFFALCKKKQS
jgi:ubiquinone/menaquinone biosynthesis C-methylase UbiE